MLAGYRLDFNIHFMKEYIETKNITVGIVGLGLMGCSIAACLLMANHPVVAIATLPQDLDHAADRIQEHLEGAYREGLIKNDARDYLNRLTITTDYGKLKNCSVVLECVIEDIEIKKKIYKRIADIVSPDALITTNTSAIPISILQKQVAHPERFFGLHWLEPSHTTRFLEIICGDLSDQHKGKYLYNLSHYWQKEPTLLLKDIRGFITNRLMYAMYREAFNLVENGYATVEDVDRACRNNAGYWMTLVGVFRWMDLTGVPAYHTVMKDLFPTLSNQTEVPKLIDDIVKAGGKGVANGKGFYEYEPGEPEMWEKTFAEFTYEIRKLALKYPADVVKKRLKGIV